MSFGNQSFWTYESDALALIEIQINHGGAFSYSVFTYTSIAPSPIPLRIARNIRIVNITIL